MPALDTHDSLYPSDSDASGATAVVNTSEPISDPPSTSALSVSPSTSSLLSNAVATSSKFLLPIPTPASNKSQSSFALPELADDESLDELPIDIAGADISISGECSTSSLSVATDDVSEHGTADGSFVETTSGPAARELKRRYDQQFGVNKDTRSPYIITAIINQHGKQVFRVG